MVDIGATTPAAAVRHRDASLDGSAVRSEIVVRPADDAALAHYERFCEAAIHAPAQHPIWVRSWVDAANRDAFVVFIERAGTAIASLALEVVKEGPFRVARFMGGRHANGNFVATRPGVPALDASERDGLIRAIRAARPDVDLVMLERQNPAQAGQANVLTALRSAESPNVSLAVDLDGGFDGTLSRCSGKRKRKKFRLQLRKFEEAGGHRLIEATSEAEVDWLLTEYFVMKAARFRKKGIHDVFAAREVQAFFRQLYTRSLAQPEPSFVLHGVEVAGEVRAVNALSIQAESVVCEFGGIRDDGSNASPGYFLDYTNIEQACALGKKLYDFSVGDEDYKRSWCDVETWQFDVLLPLTAKGRVLHVYEATRARAVRAVKSNEAIWSLVKRMRQGKAETKPDADD